MGSRCFITGCIIILGVISFNRGDKTMLSPPDHQNSPSPIPSSVPHEWLKENKTYNEDIAHILKTLAERNTNTIAEKFAKIFGDFIRKNETLKPFADFAEEVTKTTIRWLAGVIATRVYNVTRRVHSSEYVGLALKKEMESLKEITNKAIEDSKETLKNTAIIAIDKKAKLLIEDETKHWRKILDDGNVAKKISQIPGFDEALAEAVKKVLEETGDELAKEAYKKLKSPEKDKVVGGIFDTASKVVLSAVNGTFRVVGNVAKASGERAIGGATVIRNCITAVHDQLIDDFVKLDEAGIPIHIIV